MLFTSCVPISCVGVSSVQGYLHLLLGDPLGLIGPSDPLGPSDPIIYPGCAKIRAWR